jgi:hypothetical protein
MHTLRGMASRRSFWRDALVDALRLGLLKFSRPSAFDYQGSWGLLAGRAIKQPP